jgi:hypothetical protein
MGGIYEKFNKDWFRHSKVDGGKRRQHGDSISLLSFLKVRKLG